MPRVADATAEPDSQVQEQTSPAPSRMPGRASVEVPGEITRKAAPASVRRPDKPGVEMSPRSRVDIDDYAETDLGPVRNALPTFDALVVYLGTRRNKSESLRGHMHVEKFENADGELTERLVPVSGDGIQCYDFSSHGTDGRAIRERLLPSDSRDPQLANRPALPVNHPDHLLYFFKARESENGPFAYKVLVAKHQRLAWQDFILKNNRFDAQSGVDVALVDAMLKDV